MFIMPFGIEFAFICSISLLWLISFSFSSFSLSSEDESNGITATGLDFSCLSDELCFSSSKMGLLLLSDEWTISSSSSIWPSSLLLSNFPAKLSIMFDSEGAWFCCLFDSSSFGFLFGSESLDNSISSVLDCFSFSSSFWFSESFPDSDLELLISSSLSETSVIGIGTISFSSSLLSTSLLSWWLSNMTPVLFMSGISGSYSL